MTDNINHPKHYTSEGIECIEALKAATEGLEGIEAVCTANAIKYLWRWKRKNGAEDLRKAIWYIERLLKETEPEIHVETCKERLHRDKPWEINPTYVGGCCGCPNEYGYAGTPEYCDHGVDPDRCKKCWDRPVEQGADDDGEAAGHSNRDEPKDKKVEE